MAEIYKIERAKRKSLLEVSEAYHTAFAREIALSAVDIVRSELEGAVEEITSKIVIESATPFTPGKVWFTTAELKARWGCSDDFIKSIPDTSLKPHYLGSGSSMKRFLALDVYRHEGLLSKSEHNKLKSIKNAS